MAAKTNKPNKSFPELTQAGEKAYQLAVKYRAEVEPRVGPVLIDGLRTDLDGLKTKVSGTKATRTTSKSATANQDSKLETAHAVLSAIRNAVKKSDAPADVRSAYGLSTKLNANVVTSVVAAGKVAIVRARKDPAEARSLGIVDADINTLETLLAAAETADKEQEKTLAAAPLSTAERNAAAKRIDSAIRHISAKGVLAFALDPDVRAQFDALDDGPALKRPAPKPA